MLISGQEAYAIYDVNIYWTYIDPNGIRQHNGTGFSTAYKKNPGKAMIALDTQYVWWPKYKAAQPIHCKDAQDLYVTARFVRWETWVQGWFSHWTFDVGQTDQEALFSFEMFVSRMQRLNYEGHTYTKYTGDDGKEFSYRKDPYCLMGAEDNWRWFGGVAKDKDEDGYEVRTTAPCRCDGCKKTGRLRICH